MNVRTRQCPLCSSLQVEVYHNKVWSCDHGQVLHCRACDVLFLDSAMTENEAKDFYQNYGKHIVERGGIQATDSPSELYEIMLRPARYRFQYIGGYFQRSARILEIGASVGSFLGVLLENGFSPEHLTAVEPSSGHSEYVRKSLGIEVYEDINALPQQQQYNIVCMFHVFEHIANPKLFLDTIRMLLKPDGILVIEVPSHTDALLRVYNLTEFKNFYFQPMHPYIYSPKSVKSIMERYGFQVEAVIPSQRYSLDNHLNWFFNKTPGGNKVYATIFNGTADDAYRHALEQAGFADTLFAIVHP